MLYSDSRSRGNVLFLILIAVALFAALSYAVTSSTRNPTSNNSETEKMGAARILNFYTSLKSGIDRMTLSGNISVIDLAFNNDIFKRKDGSIALAMGIPSNPSVYVFHPSGGGVIAQTFEDISRPCATCSTASTAAGHSTITWKNIPQIGSDASDLVLTVNQITQGACAAINASEGITSISDQLSFPSADFTTGAAQPVVTVASGSDITAITGKFIFCYHIATQDRYQVMAILKAY
ncbi:MAG: hypothetical protein DI586_02795 [Micavibrio aeruginosavorus]|uniref:Uncharacterized protein n=1 Tax=Micavibrio aeruginosavorus TaxID=349221 RepID=A0A2W5FL19_9BACT|nr:MAG: hypothetical protein DI586_02795 [Micavibrio aeruginosavorus]